MPELGRRSRPDHRRHHRRVRQCLRDIPADRGVLHAGSDGAARPAGPGVTALDLRAYHQGARPARGARRHPPGANRRRNRRLNSFAPHAATAPSRSGPSSTSSPLPTPCPTITGCPQPNPRPTRCALNCHKSALHKHQRNCPQRPQVSAGRRMNGPAIGKNADERTIHPMRRARPRCRWVPGPGRLVRSYG